MNGSGASPGLGPGRIGKIPERRFCRRGRLTGLAAPGVGLVVLVGLTLGLCPGAAAQWVSQTVTLEPGWNAVFVEVEPQPESCAAVFEGIPVEGVWYWRPETSSVQFITNPDELVPDAPDWRAYFPPTSLAHALTTLRVVRGNRPYLIKLEGDVDVEWTVRGAPSLRPIEWIPDSFNLVGFNVMADSGPTFEGLFSCSPAHAGQAVYRLSDAGQWELVADPAAAGPSSGEAFWVYTSGPSEYQGPIHVALEMARGLEFGRGVTELTVRIENDTATEKNYLLEPKDSEAPGDPESPALAGPVPLAYWKDDYASQDVGWRPSTGPISVSVAAGDYRPVKFAVLRKEMVPPPAKVAGEFLYQSILEISDGAGCLLGIPVTAKGLGRVLGAKQETHPLAGLWIGTTTLNAVSEPANGADPTSPQPTGSEFGFQIIVHVDAEGTPRLLQQVTQMWKDGTYMPDPENPQRQIVDTPGEYVLITDETLLAGFQGSGERGGVPVGRRFSCPAFGFREPIEMAGPFPTPDQPTNSIGCTVELDYEDPLNPFMHPYHPDHNNLDERYEEVLEEGKESFTVTREIALEFADYASSSKEEDEVLLAAYAGWGDTWIGGVYRETITGLHRDSIHVEGTFRLNFVSDVAELNPEN